MQLFSVPFVARWFDLIWSPFYCSTFFYADTRLFGVFVAECVCVKFKLPYFERYKRILMSSHWFVFYGNSEVSQRMSDCNTQPIHVIITFFLLLLCKKEQQPKWRAQKESDSDLLSTPANHTNKWRSRFEKVWRKKYECDLQTHVNFHFIGPIMPRVNGQLMAKCQPQPTAAVAFFILSQKLQQHETTQQVLLSCSLFLLTIFMTAIDHQFVRMKFDRFIGEADDEQNSGKSADL